MAKLTRAAILAADDIKTEAVLVPEWSGSVLVRGLTGAQRDKFETKIIEQRGTKQIWHREHIRAWMVVMSVVDEDGDYLFSDTDVAAVSQKSAGALERIFSAAQRLSGITRSDVEELSKN